MIVQGFILSEGLRESGDSEKSKFFSKRCWPPSEVLIKLKSFPDGKRWFF